MKNLAKMLRFYGLLTIISLLSCQSTCEDIFYEVTAVELIPRKADQPTLGHALWRNEDQLSVSSLRLKLEIFKPIQYGGGTAMSDECRPNFIITNPATGLKLISNKNFNSQYPEGSNLMENVSFSLFDSRKISEKEFLDTQFNVTNLNYYFMEFKTKPDKNDIHSLILSVTFSNGSELKSTVTEVLLRP